MTLLSKIWIAGVLAIVGITSVDYFTNKPAPTTTNALDIARHSLHRPVFGNLAPGLNTLGTNATTSTLSDIINASSNPSTAIIAGLGYTPAPNTSPALAGSPTSPTQAATDASTIIANDAFVQSLFPFTPAVKASIKSGQSAATNTASFNSWISGLSGSGGTLVFPCGSFQFTGPLAIPNNNVWIQGGGEGCTTIQITNSGGSDGFEFNTSGNFGGLHDLNITQTVISPTPTTGCLVNFNGGSNLIAYNLILKQGWNNFCKNNVGTTYMVNINSSNYYNDGWLTNGEVLGIIIGVTNTETGSYHGNAACEIQSSQGFRMGESTCQASTYDMLIDPGANQAVGTFDVSNSNFDYGQTCALKEVTTSAGGLIFQGRFVNVGFSFSSGCGINISGYNGAGGPTIVNQEFLGDNVNRDTTQGYVLSSGADYITILGGQVDNNNTGAGGNNICGIEVDNVNHVTIQGVDIGTYLNSSFTGTGSSPTYLANGQCGLYITSNFANTSVASIGPLMAQGNSQYDFSNQSLSPYIAVRGLGSAVIASGSYLPCQKGQGTIASGGSSVAITFPYNFVSTPSFVSAGPFVASGATASGFTASTLSGTVSGAKTFSYDAELNNTICQ